MITTQSPRDPCIAVAWTLNIILLLVSSNASAHEVRPAYLDIRAEAGESAAATEGAQGSNIYQTFWKVPTLGGVTLPIKINWPQNCRIDGIPATRLVDASYTERATLICSESIQGQSVAIEGLEKTLTDALFKYTNLQGQVQSGRLTPSETRVTIKHEPDVFEVFVTYLELGVEHIWSGIDHLLFVICLLFIAGTFKRVLITITGFTIAHSITLAAAALGLVSLNQAPVEACIALSIVLLAREIVLGNNTSLAYRFPVGVAFCFGLLHGFGFAAALDEIGLPLNDKVLALLMFNVGVEVGQIVFIGAVIVIFNWVTRWLNDIRERQLTFTANYCIGIVSCYWFITRLLAM